MRDLKQGDLVDRKVIRPKKRSITLSVVWNVFAQQTVSVELMDITSIWWNYYQHSLCCSLLWRDIISTPRLLSILLGKFSTIERYDHHLKEHYQYCRRCSSHWTRKWMIDLLMSFCSIYNISLRH